MELVTRIFGAMESCNWVSMNSSFLRYDFATRKKYAYLANIVNTFYRRDNQKIFLLRSLNFRIISRLQRLPLKQRLLIDEALSSQNTPSLDVHYVLLDIGPGPLRRFLRACSIRGHVVSRRSWERYNFLVYVVSEFLDFDVHFLNVVFSNYD